MFDISRITDIYYVYISFIREVIIITIIIIFLLILIILKQLKYIKELILPTHKSVFDIIIVTISVCVIAFITYNYANTMINYLIGLLGIILFVTMWLKQGITLKGFTSMYRYKEIIFWNEIEKLDVHKTNNIKITLFGKFMEQSFKFKNKDYDKIMDILKTIYINQNHKL